MKIYLVMRDSGDGARLGVPVKAFDDESSAKSYQRGCLEWETRVGQFRQEFWVTRVELDCRLVSGRGELTTNRVTILGIVLRLYCCCRTV